MSNSESFDNGDSRRHTEDHKAMDYEPLKYTGLLDNYKFVDLTPAIGREYPDVQLVDLMSLPNADSVIRDLAIIGIDFRYPGN